MMLGKSSRRRIAVQSMAIAAVIAIAWWFIGNISSSLEVSGIAVDFRFLSLPASFELGESLLPFKSGDSIWRAFLAGVSNTLLVSALGIVLATLIGVLVGVARLSSDTLLSRVAFGFVETIRNTPLLLQLLFWHTLFTAGLPPPRRAISYFDCVFLTNRGLFFPSPTPWGWWLLSGGLLGLLIGAVVAWRYVPNRLRLPALIVGGLLLTVSGAIVRSLTGTAMLTCPHLQVFNIAGGTSFSTEFLAILIALSLYASSYISEVVRGSIVAVPKGQIEAAKALGLRPGRILRLVVLPQALKTMIPPMTSQYLGLLKSSSLAVAVGYPDLIRVSMVTISQTGRAVECMTIVMLVYLSISLSIATAMNIYNRHHLGRTFE
jgi:general L-amino acid transport system permease protein